ncbi:hypothetical protein A6A26_05960 [Pantoea sp. OXWO6B1]|nr:hypothetical protein A6A26_05960 [Pantoea sp. OXWO6B1]
MGCRFSTNTVFNLVLSFRWHPGILASSACQFHLFYAGLNAAMTGGLSRIPPFPCTLKGINKGILAEPA